MNAQARAYGISVGIHALVFGSILALGLIAPRTRTLVLDFSITGPSKAGQEASMPAERQRAAAVPEQKAVTPTAQEEQAAPVKKELAEEIARPVLQQPMTAATSEGTGDSSSSSLSSAEAAKEAFVTANFRHIRDKILRNLSYPQMARRMGWTGKVNVLFTVCMDGSVEGVSVVESSGFPVLDQNAVETIKKSCPLPKPPVKTALVMPVVYRLE